MMGNSNIIIGCQWPDSASRDALHYSSAGTGRRLKHVDASDMELLVEMVMACCVLHNLCLLSSDGADDILSDEDNQQWPAAGEDGAINNEERAAKRSGTTYKPIGLVFHE